MDSGGSSDEEMEEVQVGEAVGAPTGTRAEEGTESESEDGMEWDEVAGPSATEQSMAEALHEEDQDTEDVAQGVEIGQEPINIVLDRVKQAKAKKRTANSAVERAIRHETHRTHTLCLVMAGLVRNRLLNDPLLKARLLSLVPLRLANAFASFTPQTHPNERDRSRMFDNAMRDLVSWWWQVFELDDDVEGVKLRTWAEAEALFTIGSSPKGKGKAKDPFESLLDSGEPVHTSKSLMKRAVLRRGTRDMSAQLFAALLRALDIPTRLVFSLQPVTWRGAGGGGRAVGDSGDESELTPAPKAKVKGKGRAKAAPTSVAARRATAKKPAKTHVVSKAMKAAQVVKARRGGGGTASETYTAGDSDSDGDFEPVDIPSSADRGEGTSSRPLSVGDTDDEERRQRQSWMSTPAGKASKKAPPVKLRATRPTKAGRHWAKSPSPGPDELARPPVWWVEVYSRPAKEWYTVDVTRKRLRCKNIMEPAKSNPENRMVYVVAYEEDHFVRDVTPKYSHSFGGTTVKLRLPSRKGSDWFAEAIRPLKRPYKLVRDEKEDAEIERSQTSEAMPTTVAGFKDHPNFVLERHLKSAEVIHPRRQLGTFRGDPVFPRSSVISLKSAENFMREGRRIKAGEQPLKLVKARAVTINRRREQAAAEAEGLEPAMQGLYADWQTELLIPPPIVDGEIPRNSYGNMDLFAPHMLPRGAVHLPYKGIAKIAKQLKFSFAEAVTGFEFHKRRAVPVVEGIVVADAVKEMVWEAYWSSEEAALEKQMTKVQERSLKRWKKLILGLRIRHRLQEEYKQKLAATQKKTAHPEEGRSELRDVIQNADELGARPTVQAEEAELFADHQMNALTMPKPARSAYTLTGHRRKRTDSESGSGSDSDEPAPSTSKAATNGKRSSLRKTSNRPAKRVSLRVPAAKKRSLRSNAIDTSD